MSETPNKYKEKQNKLEGFELLPNDSAQLLEDTVGISFGETKPIKVKMDTKLALKLAAEAQKTKGIMWAFTRLVSIARDRSRTGAEYYPEMDVLVVVQPQLLGEKHQQEEERRMEMHENMHAWQLRINEEYMLAPQQDIAALIKNLEKDQSPENYQKVIAIVEKYMLSKILTEGMCDFASIYTGLTSETVKDKGPYLVRHLEQTDPDADPSTIFDNDWSFYDFNETQYVTEVRALYAARDALVAAITSGNVIEVLRVQKETFSLWYDLGYKLLQIVVESGVESGMTVADSLKRVMERPFERFDQLIDLEQLEQITSDQAES